MTKQITDILLCTAGTPNGQKVSITLEELGLKYDTTHIEPLEDERSEYWFLKISPNGRIPAKFGEVNDSSLSETLVETLEDIEKSAFNGAAVLLYLTARYDNKYKISYPFDSDRYWEVVDWVMWCQDGFSPIQGHTNYYPRSSPELDYAVEGPQTEIKRLYNVLEARLATQREQKHTVANTKASTAELEEITNQSPGPWLVGKKLTIADLACFALANFNGWSGLTPYTYPEVVDWLSRINKRPAVLEGLNIPEKLRLERARSLRW